MRLPNDHRFGLLAKGIAGLAVAAGLAACTTGPEDPPVVSDASRINGPQADYPVVVGDPYQIDGTEYVPVDTLNYDHVGFVAVDQDATGYTGAHHTLPLPSYVEVTSLETGRTILVRLERRGPMESSHLLALAPAAMAQLGAASETPVRVRRVNPPEDQRSLLRAGVAAPIRMDTPPSLLAVLQRRLPASGAVSLQGPEAEPMNSWDIETGDLTASSASPPLGASHAASVSPPDETETVETFATAFSSAEESSPTDTAELPRSAEPEGIYLVQAAAFSSMERAERVAEAIGGVVTQYGDYFRVRTGPFATRGEAEASLANVRRAGYTDARILTNG